MTRKFPVKPKRVAEVLKLFLYRSIYCRIKICIGGLKIWRGKALYFNDTKFPGKAKLPKNLLDVIIGLSIISRKDFEVKVSEFLLEKLTFFLFGLDNIITNV